MTVCTERAIYGEARGDEARALIEDGVPGGTAAISCPTQGELSRANPPQNFPPRSTRPDGREQHGHAPIVSRGNRGIGRRCTPVWQSEATRFWALNGGRQARACCAARCTEPDSVQAMAAGRRDAAGPEVCSAGIMPMWQEAGLRLPSRRCGRRIATTYRRTRGIQALLPGLLAAAARSRSSRRRWHRTRARRGALYLPRLQGRSAEPWAATWRWTLLGVDIAVGIYHPAGCSTDMGGSGPHHGRGGAAG